jgi:hypothetical protein
MDLAQLRKLVSCKWLQSSRESHNPASVARCASLPPSRFFLPNMDLCARSWRGSERFCRPYVRLAIGSALVVYVVPVFALRLGRL